MSVLPVEDVLRASGLLNLSKDPPPSAIEASLRAFAVTIQRDQDPLRRRLLRDGAIRALSEAGVRSPAGLVDAALDHVVGEVGAESGPRGRRIALEDPEPWPEPVDAGDLAAGLEHAFERFVVLPDSAAVALVLWTIHAHALAALEVSPILALTSPQKRCGKTTTLTLLSALVPRPLLNSNLTPASVFRVVEQYQPALLIDEADSFLREREELRGLLNSGHHRAGAWVVRVVGDELEPRVFCTFGPKAVGLIGRLPPTLQDRSIEVRLERRTKDQAVERLRLDRLSELEPLRRQAWTWAQAHLEHLRKADPPLPEVLNDRQRDNWRPLVAIADLLGGSWPERAREAAVRLSQATAEEEDEAAILLLQDLQDIFAETGRDRLTSSEITGRLAIMEERPWPAWGRSQQPISARSVARLLRPFGIRPRPMDWSGVHAKGTRGYRREDFAEAWKRYIPAQDPVSEAQLPQPSNNDGTFLGFPMCNPEGRVADAESGEKARKTYKVAVVADGSTGSAALDLWQSATRGGEP